MDPVGKSGLMPTQPMSPSNMLAHGWLITDPSIDFRGWWRLFLSQIIQTRSVYIYMCVCVRMYVLSSIKVLYIFLVMLFSF